MPKRSRRAAAKTRDPYLEREARKYENPIPSREFILQQLDAAGVPLNLVELAEQLNLFKEDDLEALRRRLNAMERDGQLLRNRRGGFCRVNHTDLVAGRVIGHPDGFGFLKPDSGGDDLFLAPRQMRSLLNGDRAVVRVVGIDHRGRREAALVEVLERHNSKVTGRIHLEGGIGFVTPDNKRLHQDILVPADSLAGATQGQMVVVEITEQPGKRNRPAGHVVQVLGDHMAPGLEIEVAIHSHQLPVEWPDEVEQQVARIPDQVPESAKRGRKDLRQLPLVTIDGEDARDFDDAVCAIPTRNGWRLLVCIADVSAYVEPGSPLDKEAQKRGNSVYFPNRVIPMLPEKLSNGLCSINPKVDRLCMTCELLVNREGEVTRSRFYEAVMRSKARLTYTEVAAVIDGDPKACKRNSELLPAIYHLYDLYKILLQAREARGAIDFDSTETRFRFDDNLKIEEIVPVQRNEAHRLIEECMLAANVATAKFLIKRRQPALFRNHESPPLDKLTDLRTFLREFGLNLAGGDKPSAADYAGLSRQVAERPDAHLIQTVLLRSMSQAMYSNENLGHFGLAYEAYTHFTSPIRRYPDLLVHRAIKHQLAGGNGRDFEYTPSRLQALGEHCSNTERRADEATREVDSWLKCEYMLEQVGGVFDGIISSVTSFGLFVELTDIYVEGLVHITSLDNDFYHFDPVGHRLTGERSGRVYRLGDPIRVQVASVNLDEKKIDFLPVEKKRGRKSRQEPAGKRASKPSERQGGREKKRGRGKRR